MTKTPGVRFRGVLCVAAAGCHHICQTDANNDKYPEDFAWGQHHGKDENTNAAGTDNFEIADRSLFGIRRQRGGINHHQRRDCTKQCGNCWSGNNRRKVGPVG